MYYINYFLKQILSLNKFSHYITLSCFLLLILTYVLYIILVVKTRSKKFVNNYITLALLLNCISSFFILLDYTNNKILVTSSIEMICYIFLFAITTLLLIYTMQIVYKPRHNIFLQTQKDDNAIPKHPIIDTSKKVIEVKCGEMVDDKTEFIGYLDVDYLKNLIKILKEKELSLTDKKEIDDFDIFLLNFVGRQPNELEREKLNGYLSGFMKKLAKYQVV